MQEFKATNSKRNIVINCASYKDAVHLKKCILNEIIKYPIGLKLKGEGANVLGQDLDVTQLFDFIKNVIVSMDISEELNNAIFQCLSVCTWDLKKITMDLFDEFPEIREDEYEIKFKCIEENLKPFIKSLSSQWKMYAPKIGENPVLNQLLTSQNS